MCTDTNTRRIYFVQCTEIDISIEIVCNRNLISNTIYRFGWPLKEISYKEFDLFFCLLYLRWFPKIAFWIHFIQQSMAVLFVCFFDIQPQQTAIIHRIMTVYEWKSTIYWTCCFFGMLCVCFFLVECYVISSMTHMRVMVVTVHNRSDISC